MANTPITLDSANLSPEQMRLLEAFLRDHAKARQTPPEDRLRPVDRDQPIPLSFAQQRLWFLDQLEPGNTAYNVNATVRLVGKLDVTALEGSFTEVILRHETLRTTFNVVEGEPIQSIQSPKKHRLEMVNFKSLPQNSRLSSASRLVRDHLILGFDLANGPLLRTLLIRMNEAEHVLAISLHHIVTDGWSMKILFHELSTAYQALRQRESTPFAPLNIQYADFVFWQRNRLKGDRLKEQLNYWKSKLSGIPEVLTIPTCYSRSAKTNRGRGLYPTEISDAVAAELKALGQQTGATTFIANLTAWAIILHRYSGQPDIAIGTPIANRTHPELEKLIGFFANTLVLRSSVDGNPSFDDALKRMRNTCLTAYDNQDMPFERVVEEIQPRRSLTHTPLVQVLRLTQHAGSSIDHGIRLAISAGTAWQRGKRTGWHRQVRPKSFAH